MALLIHILYLAFMWKVVSSECGSTKPRFDIMGQNSYTVTIYYPFHGDVSESHIYLYYDEVNFSCDTQIVVAERFGDYVKNDRSNISSCSNETKQCYFQIKVGKLGYYCGQMTISGCPSNTYFSPTIKLSLATNNGNNNKPDIPPTESPPVFLWILIAICLCSFVIISFIAYKIVRHNACLKQMQSSIDVTPHFSDEEYEPLTKIVQIFVLYHNDNDEHFNNVKTFVNDLQKLKNCEVIVDYNYKNDISRFGMTSWVSRMLKMSDRIVIISSEGAYTKVQLRNKLKIKPNEYTDTETAFLFGWNMIMSDPRMMSDYTKLFNIRFEQTDLRYLLPDVVSGRHFKIPCDYEKLTCQLLQGNGWK